MVFAVLITTDSLSTINSCLKFIQAALAKAHVINVVYLRGPAVYQANKNLVFAYQDLVNKNIEILVCYSSATARGLKQDLLQPNATFAGSATLAEKIAAAERLICFN